MRKLILICALALSGAPALFSADFFLANYDARRLRGVSICATAPTDTQVLTYSSSGASWCPATPSAGVSLGGADNQFAYRSASGALLTSAFLVNSPTSLLRTPVGPALFNGTNGCYIYMSAPSGTFPRNERLTFDCSGVTSGPFPQFELYDGLNTAVYTSQSAGSNGSNFAFSGFSNGVGTDTDNFKTWVSVNSTLAAVGAQQYSPAEWRCGNGWKTTATAASQTVCFQDQIKPVQGAASPSGLYVFSSIINAVKVDKFIINSLGSAGPTPSASDPGCAAATLGQIWFDSTSAVTTVMKACMNVASTPTWVTK